MYVFVATYTSRATGSCGTCCRQQARRETIMRTFIHAFIALVFTTQQAGCHKSDDGSPVVPQITDHLVEFICTTSSEADLMSVGYRIKDSVAMYSVEGHFWNSVVRLHSGTNVGLTCAAASTSRSVITVEAKIKLDSLDWKSAAKTDTFNIRVSTEGIIP